MKKALFCASVIVAFLFAAMTAQAQTKYKIHRYDDSRTGGIFTNISANGKWGVINTGSESAGGNAPSMLYNFDTDKTVEIVNDLGAAKFKDVTDDGNIVVGSLNSRPCYRVLSERDDEETAGLYFIPLRTEPGYGSWKSGSVNAVTPDGKFMVGAFTNYQGKALPDYHGNDADMEDADFSYWYYPFYYDVEKGKVIELTGLPTKDMMHGNSMQNEFMDISADGRYILGRMSWSYIAPVQIFSYVYDIQTHTYDVVGFTESASRSWTPKTTGLLFTDFPVMSPDGRWVSGEAYMSKAMPGSDFNTEYKIPFRYDVYNKTFEAFDVVGNAGRPITAVNNAGTLFAAPENGGPLRDFYVYYKDKFWISLEEICRQYYGFDFKAKTGYENTGTVQGTSGDGRRYIAFPDPSGESYCFDFGEETVEDVCAHVDLLASYSVTPMDGSEVSVLQNITVAFDRAVDFRGDVSDVKLYDGAGNFVASPSSNGGITVDGNTLHLNFRKRSLNVGETYKLVISANALAVANDVTIRNKEITVKYKIRSNGPVKVVTRYPESGSELQKLDNTSSYVLLTFDTKVQLTEQASAWIYRLEEEGDSTLLANLTVMYKDNQVLLAPPATIYLYQGKNYCVVLDEGSVSDFSLDPTSYNTRESLNIKGAYEQQIQTNDKTIFAESFDVTSEALNTWLRYEGDHNQPESTYSDMEFDADNQPWNFSIRDEGSENRCAASHSVYVPSGASDDWMMTPRLEIPAGVKSHMTFNAASISPSKSDVLKVYVWEKEQTYTRINNATANLIKAEAKCVFEEKLNPNGGTLEGNWTKYDIDLSEYAGKYIYIAFVNQNYNQSAICVDDILVERFVPYTIAFSNESRVVNQSSVTIAGSLKVEVSEEVKDVTLTLLDAEGQAVSTLTYQDVYVSQGDKMPFKFNAPLALTPGEAVEYTINVKFDDIVDDNFKGVIENLAFNPVKRVVLEEFTGRDCGNCPQGLLVFDILKRQFGEHVLPISIHGYEGDPLGNGMEGYYTTLGLNAAPSARINRGPVSFPMATVDGKAVYTNPELNNLWYDVVVSELNVPTLSDVTAEAYADDKLNRLIIPVNVRYALDVKNQNLNIFAVVVEDNISQLYQLNYFAESTDPVWGDWGKGGKYGSGYVLGLAADDVSRMCIGNGFSGTGGLLPQNLNAGQTYSASITANYPGRVENIDNARVIVMLIDANTDKIINAVSTKIVKGVPNAIEGVEDEATAMPANAALYSATGALLKQNATKADLQSLPAGFYIFGGKKISVK